MPPGFCGFDRLGACCLLDLNAWFVTIGQKSGFRGVYQSKPLQNVGRSNARPARIQGKNLGFDGGNQGVAAYRNPAIKMTPAATVNKFLVLTPCQCQPAERRCRTERDRNTERSTTANMISCREENAPPGTNKTIMQPWYANMSLNSREESFHCFGPSPDFDGPSGDIFRRYSSKIRIPVNKPKAFFAQRGSTTAIS